MAFAHTRIAHLSLAACGAALALFGARAESGTVIGHCVSNAQQLQNALSACSTGGQYNGSDNRIKIVQGLYQTRLVTVPSPGTFYYESQADTGKLSIEGGYNSDCSARSSNPLTTLIDGDFTDQVMLLNNKKAQIKVSGVTIENGESTREGAGLAINDSSTYRSSALVFDTIIRNNHATQFGGGLFAASAGAGNQTVVHNTLVVDNSADLGDSAVELISNGDGVDFHDNTVSGNSVAGSTPENSVYINTASAPCDVTNNIIDHNPNGGLWMSCGAATLSYNDVGNIINDGGAVQIGNVAVDPDFVDADGGDFRLASGSPLFGLSPMLVNDGTDLDGNPYPASGRQDIGAYEDTVFVGGFDAAD